MAEFRPTLLDLRAKVRLFEGDILIELLYDGEVQGTAIIDKDDLRDLIADPFGSDFE